MPGGRGLSQTLQRDKNHGFCNVHALQTQGGSLPDQDCTESMVERRKASISAASSSSMSFCIFNWRKRQFFYGTGS